MTLWARLFGGQFRRVNGQGMFHQMQAHLIHTKLALVSSLDLEALGSGRDSSWLNRVWLTVPVRPGLKT
jgi:hypothetical protein